jgi:MSHA biogenesis protein MshG
MSPVMEKWESRIRPSSLLSAVCWTILLLLLSAAIFLCLIDGGPAADSSEGLVLFAIVGVVALFILFQATFGKFSRRRRAAIVLEYIDDAIRLNLPLASAILSAATSEIGKTRLRLLSLHDGLEQGQSLGEAIYRSVPEIPLATVRAIAAADEMGCLSRIMPRLARRATPRHQIGGNLDTYYGLYAFGVVLTVMIGIGCLLVCKVMPKFNDILKSFGQPMPWTTRALERMDTPYVSMEVVGVILLVAGLGSIRSFRDYCISWIPVAGAAARDRGLADSCDFLVDALESGQPMNVAVSHAAEAQSNAVLRRRMRRWAAAMENGQPPRDSARAAGMPVLLSSMLATARGGEDWIQVLAFLARHYENRLSRLREIVRATAVPIMVLVMGAGVLFLALCVFQPMIVLVQANMTHHAGGF